MTPDTVVEPYDKIRIKKGTVYRTTHPQKDGDQIVKRTYVTKANTTSGRHEDRVTWSGTGGYWCWAKKIDVELIQQGEE